MSLDRVTKLLTPMMDLSAIFIICFMTSLQCTFLGALPCPPVFSPNTTEFICSSPSLSDFPTGFPKQTRIISVEYTNISIISVDALRALPHLQELHLANNRLKTLPNSLFRDLPELTALDLTGNLLKDLPPGIFRNNSALKQLSLKGNQLTLLRPSWFQALRHLKILDLSNNKLKEVPDLCFDKLEQLSDLDLSHNFLRTLSAPIFQGLPRLTGLNLEVNQLQLIADETFHDVPELKFLFLQNNSLDKLPAKVFEPLKLLEMLDISHNRLSSLDPPFSGQVAEPGLDLSGNPWVCDCRMHALVNWAENNSVSLYSKKEVICSSPKDLEGRAVTSLSELEFGSC